VPCICRGKYGERFSRLPELVIGGRAQFNAKYLLTLREPGGHVCSNYAILCSDCLIGA
jgi:hypothetical protein